MFGVGVRQAFAARLRRAANRGQRSGMQLERVAQIGQTKSVNHPRSKFRGIRV
jgi:hypothetical protein